MAASKVTLFKELGSCFPHCTATAGEAPAAVPGTRELGSAWLCLERAELTCVDVAQDAECDGNIDLVYDEFLSQGVEKSF